MFFVCELFSSRVEVVFTFNTSINSVILIIFVLRTTNQDKHSAPVRSTTQSYDII